MELKIVALSDMHGMLPEIKESADIALIAGDIVPLSIQNHNASTYEWLYDTFLNWSKNLPVDKIFVIPGNHDWGLYVDDIIFNEISSKVAEKSEGKVILAKDDIFEYNGFRIITTPWCKEFYNWAYMLSSNKLEEKYNALLEKNKEKPVDILLTHDAPYGVSDQLLEQTVWNPITPGPHIGNKPLAKFVKQLKPSYHFHGHLHSTNHEKEALDNTIIYNVSIVNEAYQTIYPPLYLTITKE